MDDLHVVDLTVDTGDEDHHQSSASQDGDNPAGIFYVELDADVVDLESNEDALDEQDAFESMAPFPTSHQQQHQTKQTHPSRVKQASRMHQRRVKQQNPLLFPPRETAAEKVQSVNERLPGAQEIRQQNASPHQPRIVAATTKPSLSKKTWATRNESSQQRSPEKSRIRPRGRGNRPVENGGRLGQAQRKLEKFSHSRDRPRDSYRGSTESATSPNGPQQRAKKRPGQRPQNRKLPHDGWEHGASSVHWPQNIQCSRKRPRDGWRDEANSAPHPNKLQNLEQSRKRPYEGSWQGNSAPPLANPWVQERRRNYDGPNVRYWNRQAACNNDQSRLYDQQAPSYQAEHCGPSIHCAYWEAKSGPGDRHWNRNQEFHQRRNEPRVHGYRPGSGHFGRGHGLGPVDRDANVGRLNMCDRDPKRQKASVRRNESERTENRSAHRTSPRCFYRGERKVEGKWGSMEARCETLERNKQNQVSANTVDQERSAATLADAPTRVLVEPSTAGRQSEPLVPSQTKRNERVPSDLHARQFSATFSSGRSRKPGTTRSLQRLSAFAADDSVTLPAACVEGQKLENPSRVFSEATRERNRSSKRATSSETVHWDLVRIAEVAPVFQLEQHDLHTALRKDGFTSNTEVTAVGRTVQQQSTTSCRALQGTTQVLQRKASSTEQMGGTGGEEFDNPMMVYSVDHEAEQEHILRKSQSGILSETAERVCNAEVAVSSGGELKPSVDPCSREPAQAPNADGTVSREEKAPTIACGSSGETSRNKEEAVVAPGLESRAAVQISNTDGTRSKEERAATNARGSQGATSREKKEAVVDPGLESVLTTWTKVPPKSLDWGDGNALRDLNDAAKCPAASIGGLRSRPSSRTLAESCKVSSGRRDSEASAENGSASTHTVATGLSKLQDTIGHSKGVLSSAFGSSRSATEQTKGGTRERNVSSGKIGPEAKPSGQCNFVIIDDSCDGEESEKSRARQTSKRSRKHNQSRTASSGSGKGRGSMQFDLDKNYNYSMSQETAMEIQERMFREAAARVRTQASFQLPTDPFHPPTIATPLLDIHKRYPFHWLWKDPYACLGLPPDAPISLAKSHYRKLARLYHPDKSKVANTASKFHGITMAYRKLCEHRGHV